MSIKGWGVLQCVNTGSCQMQVTLIAAEFDQMSVVLLSYGVFTLRPWIQAWPTPKFSSFMSPLEKLDLGTLPVYRWGVEATVHAKQARTNCVWDKRVQTRKCTAGAFNRPSCSSQNTAAWGRCWSWVASQMVIVPSIRKKKKIHLNCVWIYECAQHQNEVTNRVTQIKRWRRWQKYVIFLVYRWPANQLRAYRHLLCKHGYRRWKQYPPIGHLKLYCGASYYITWKCLQNIFLSSFYKPLTVCI